MVRDINSRNGLWKARVPTVSLFLTYNLEY